MAMPRDTALDVEGIHPRKQGLKQQKVGAGAGRIDVEGMHPRKQGLKQDAHRFTRRFRRC